MVYLTIYITPDFIVLYQALTNQFLTNVCSHNPVLKYLFDKVLLY